MTDQGSYVALAASWADDPWFRFPRAFIRDARLSATARAIATWMASHSTRFRFDVTTMMKANLGGRDKVRKALKELEKLGYLVRTRERNPDGSFGRILYELHPVPQGKPSSEPAPENQSVAPAPENQALVVTSENTTKPQITASDWKSGPDFQEGFKGDQPQVDQQKKEGEEGVAHAGAGAENSSNGDQPVWGVAGGRRFAGPSLASANLIAGLAREVLLEHESLTADDHQELAGLADAARQVVTDQRGLSWEEYVLWLRQGWMRADGRRTFKSFSGTLRWRLAPEQVRGQAWAWVCEHRGAQEVSEASGGRENPAPFKRAGSCGRHGTALSEEGRCLACDHDAHLEAKARAEKARAQEVSDDSEGGTGSHELSEAEFAAMMELSLQQPKASQEDLLAAAREQIAAGAEKAKTPRTRG